MNTLQHSAQRIDSLSFQRDALMSKLKMSQVGSFDVFVSLLSSTMWNSVAELSAKWIAIAAPDEWKMLQSDSNDTPSIISAKGSLRDTITEETRALIQAAIQNPSTLQRLTTRLLVSEKLLQHLPIQAHDRILSAEFATSYRTWDQILGALALHRELNEILQVSDSIRVGRDDRGDTVFSMHYHGDNLLPGSIPGVQVYSSKILSSSEGGERVPIQSEQYIVTLTQEILSRCDNLIGMQGPIDATRRIIANSIGDIMVWKRLVGGGDDPVISHIPSGQLSFQ